ncbi:MAG: glycosyltransferase [Candidatus Edwardsbacteria bacterium]|nr:glycosyltransferase [Candidatus Edwardsbacteria bacterium]
MRSILFIKPVWASGASFVGRDRGLLSEQCKVTDLSYRSGDLLFPVRAVRHFMKTDLAYVWFSGAHAFWAVVIAKMLCKKTVIVAGGYDVAHLPEIGYGMRVEGGAWRRGYWALGHTDRVLAFSEASAAEAKRVASRARVVTVPMGFDAARYPAGAAKEQLVLTVCHLKRDNLKRKGLDTFIAAARLLPQCRFTIAGRDLDGTGEQLRRGAPANVEFTGYLEEPRLLELMGKAKVYAQLSAHEGFGCALAEAMLCGCVPVVTDRGALPEVAGPDAFYCGYRDVAGTVEQIGKALKATGGPGYRQRVIDNFSLEKRARAMTTIIEHL